MFQVLQAQGAKVAGPYYSHYERAIALAQDRREAEGDQGEVLLDVPMSPRYMARLGLLHTLDRTNGDGMASDSSMSDYDSDEEDAEWDNVIAEREAAQADEDDEENRESESSDESQQGGTGMSLKA